MSERELLLLRHAKSRRDEPGVGDHDRALAARGQEDAPRVGAYLKEAGLVPDRVLTSSAKRARQTTDLVLEALGFDGESRVRSDLYLAGPAAILKTVRALPQECRRVLVVGHNPGLERTALKLARDDKAGPVAALREKYPTAALAHFVFTAEDWQEVDWGKGGLRAFVRPRDLG